MIFSKVTTGFLASAFLITGGLILQPAAGFATTSLCDVNSDFADEEWISGFSISGQSVLGTQGSTYTDNTASSLTTLQAGQSYNIDITISVDFFNTPGSNDQWDENAFAWLDLNQDGVVDLVTEQLLADGDNTANFTQIGSSDVWTKTFSTTFTVPVNAINGLSVGRVMNQFVNPGDDPIMCNSDPAAFDPGVSAFEFGSTTDFAVTIQGGVDNTPTPSATPSASSTPSITPSASSTPTSTPGASAITSAQPKLALTGENLAPQITIGLGLIVIGGVLAILALKHNK